MAACRQVAEQRLPAERVGRSPPRTDLKADRTCRLVPLVGTRRLAQWGVGEDDDSGADGVVFTRWRAQIAEPSGCQEQRRSGDHAHIQGAGRRAVWVIPGASTTHRRLPRRHVTCWPLASSLLVRCVFLDRCHAATPGLALD